MEGASRFNKRNEARMAAVLDRLLGTADLSKSFKGRIGARVCIVHVTCRRAWQPQDTTKYQAGATMFIFLSLPSYSTSRPCFSFESLFCINKYIQNMYFYADLMIKTGSNRKERPLYYIHKFPRQLFPNEHASHSHTGSDAHAHDADFLASSLHFW